MMPDIASGEFSIIVIGGGIVGTCLGGFLAEDGAEVAVIDAGHVGGTNANAGSLHVQMQSVFLERFPHLVPRLESMLYLYRRATAFWKAFQQDLGVDCEVNVTGGLMIAEDRAQLEFLAKKADRERQLGLDVAIINRNEIERMAPYLGPTVIGAEFCGDEGKVNPLLANAATRRWARDHGAVQFSEEPVARVEREGSGFRVTTARRSLRTGKVILAAGHGSRPLANQLGFDFPATGDPLHMNITEEAQPVIGHLVQHAARPITLKQLGGGQTVIGGGWPAEFGGPGKIARTRLSSMIGNLSLAQHIVPALAPLRVIRTWAGVNTMVDGCGVIGPVHSVPGLFIAIPGDAGYTLGPITARITADLVSGRKPSENIEPCTPDRFARSR
jgi:glycine/D-amino acid oxidase-like deaminating enzyme